MVNAFESNKRLIPLKKNAMTKTFLSLLSLTLFLFLNACTSADEQAIQQTLNTFFANTEMHSQVNQTALSTQLAGLLQQAIEAEKIDAEQTKNGPFPTDKPMLIEGDIFSSIYEGRTGVTVKSVQIDKQQAKAVLALENKAYKMHWTDTAILVKENEAWKIDDVVYGQSTQGSTKRVLNSFIEACRNKLNQGANSLP